MIVTLTCNLVLKNDQTVGVCCQPFFILLQNNIANNIGQAHLIFAFLGLNFFAYPVEFKVNRAINHIKMRGASCFQR